MSKIQKVIFVCQNNLCQSPVATVILKNIKRDEWLEVESRGLVVLFPEPYSLKAYTLLQNNGLHMENGTARQLEESDFAPDTYVLTMSRDQKNKIINEYALAQNVFSIMEFAGKSGDIMDPHGGNNDLYAMFYTSIYSWVNQVEIKIHEINIKEEIK